MSTRYPIRSIIKGTEFVLHSGRFTHMVSYHLKQKIDRKKSSTISDNKAIITPLNILYLYLYFFYYLQSVKKVTGSIQFSGRYPSLILSYSLFFFRLCQTFLLISTPNNRVRKSTIITNTAFL